MRHFLRFLLLLQVATIGGCAMKPFPNPQVVGRVKSASAHDIEIVIALAERDMRAAIGRAVPIKRIEVKDHDHFTVVYSYGDGTYYDPITREHGVWDTTPKIT